MIARPRRLGSRLSIEDDLVARPCDAAIESVTARGCACGCKLGDHDHVRAAPSAPQDTAILVTPFPVLPIERKKDSAMRCAILCTSSL